MATIAVLMTCFNRRETTLSSLARLEEQQLDGHDYRVFLVDDGSTDGTGDAVREQFPSVEVVEGDGTLFWSRGTDRAWTAALESGEHFDHFLVLNDDTMLDIDALSRMVTHAAELGTPSVIVGATRQPGEPGVISYGGHVPASRWNPLKTTVRQPTDARPSITMNANCVLVPAGVVDSIGRFDPIFHHSWADFDFGYRAVDNGIPLVVTDPPIGECAANDAGTDGYLRPDLTLRERIAWIRGIRGLNGSDWWVLTRRHGGVLWPLVWLSPYVNLFVTWGRQRLLRSSDR